MKERDTILVVSHTADAHALEVMRHLDAHAARVELFDTSGIAREGSLTIEHRAQAGWSGMATVRGRTIDMQRIGAVWWRRPQPFVLHPDVGGSDDCNFALGEIATAVSGLWSLLDAHWINDPDLDEKAGRKAWQLKIAREAGLTIPTTCITSDPDRARKFVRDRAGEVIYKSFSATQRTWRETRIVGAGECDLLEAVKYAPVIFQEYVQARVDLRITIVDGEIFAAEIDSQASSYPHDFRMDTTAAIASHVLPPAISSRLLRLMQVLGLAYGAIDMRLTPAGEYVFLEINPAGQWLFIEERTQQPISDRLAQALIRRISASISGGACLRGAR